MQKLLIADGTEEFRLALADALRGAYLVKVCQEGRETLRVLQSFKPDVLVLDMMMPGLDGISLLQEAAKLELRPAVLATTRFCSDYIMDRAARLGVGYVMMKPCDIRAVISRLAELTERLEPPAVTRPDSRTTLTNMLMTLGVATKLRGYRCAREAVLVFMEDPDQSMTKELYPAVAAVCGGSGEGVERAIRSAVLAAWKKRNEQVWQMFFPKGPDGHVVRPTNAEFISQLANRLVAAREEVG